MSNETDITNKRLMTGALALLILSAAMLPMVSVADEVMATPMIGLMVIQPGGAWDSNPPNADIGPMGTLRFYSSSHDQIGAGRFDIQNYIYTVQPPAPGFADTVNNDFNVYDQMSIMNGVYGIVVHETINGIKGWTGANYTGSTNMTLTNNNPDLFPNMFLEVIPTPAEGLKGTDPTPWINITWTGLLEVIEDTPLDDFNVDWVENAENVLHYSVYRSTDNVTFTRIGNSSDQARGGTVYFNDTSVSADINYYYRLAVNYKYPINNGANCIDESYAVPSNAIYPGLYVTTGLSNSSIPITIETPPTIVSTTPTDNATGVSVAPGNFITQFSKPMNTTVTAVDTDLPNPVAAWDGTGIWLNISYDALADLTEYYVNFTGQGHQTPSGVALGGDTYFNFTTGDFTPPTSNVTGPATSNTLIFNVTYATADPSGVVDVALWITDDGGLTWAPVTNDVPIGIFVDVTVPGDGLYGWYTAATDAASNSEVSPPTGPGFVEFWTLVDTVMPLIGPTTADKLYINNMGTHGGTAPPVSVTTNVSDDNLAIASWGIRNENANPNGTIYFRMDITNDTMPSIQEWDGNWYFVDGVLVTGGMCPDWFSTEIFVMGELNGNSTAEQALGYTLPSHYALYDGAGTLQGMYATLGTPEFYDDMLVPPTGGDTFRAYRYDEGMGYVATGAISAYVPGFDWANITIAPIPEGRYTVAVTAIDWVQNTNWTNEAQGNPVITVDNTAPEMNMTVPADMATAVTLNQDIVITFSEEMDTATVAYTVIPGPGNLTAVWSVGNTTLTISHDDFAEVTLYTVEVTAGKDHTGNNLAAGIVPNPWTFTTGDFTAPVANAGPDQTVNEGAIVTFDGSASTDNVGITNYTWTFTDVVPISLWGVGPNYQFNNPGIYIVTLNVSDAAGNWGIDTMTVTVNDITDPVANAGPDQTVNEGDTVTFDGSGSTDNVGIVNYTWTFTDGGPITLWSVGPLYQFNVVGIFVVTLNVTDAAGNWHTDTVTITVNDITNPVANAGPDQTVDEGTMVTFDGSASTDNVGIVNYTWTFNDGAPVTLWEIGPTYVFNTPGVYMVTLNVTDAEGNWHTDTMTVTVNDITPPVAVAGPDQTVNDGDTVTFDGSASTDNVGITNYTWTFNDGTPVTLWGVGPTYQFNNVGIFVVTLNVTDAAGNWHTDTMTVTVLDGTAPVANAGPNQTVDEGNTVTFDGSASTDNVGIVNYTWTFNDGAPVTLWGVGPTYMFINPGIFIVTLNVTDAEGNWDADTVTITVNDISDPVANAGPDQTVDEGDTVTFDGSASSDNVGIVNYTWTFFDGVAVTLWGVGPAYLFNNPGVFVVTLTVLDAAGNTHNDTMTVTVNDITDPVANAGPNQVVNEGTLVTFDGSASTDNVGIVNYTWTFFDGVAVTLWGVGSAYLFNNIGIFVVTLNVTDAAGNWHTDSMTVTVQDATAPVANAGPDQTVDEGDTVTFDGSASTDNVGIVNYTWTFNDGVSDITLYDVSPTHTFMVPGVYAVTLNVTDTDGNWNIDTMTVTVNDITNPVAEAGPNQTVDEGDTVTFDGSASTDNVGIVNYTWTFFDGVAVTLWEAGPTYMFNNPGVYVVTLNITDAAGNWHTDTMTVTVNDITPPVADAGPDQTVDEGTMVTFDGSASTDNVGIVNYTWTFTDGVAITLWGVGPAYQFNNVGIFIVTLTVMDAAGHTHAGTMTVTVNDITPPVADAGPNQIVNEGTLVTFDGSASSDNVGIVNYTWTFNDGAPVTIWSVGPAYQFNNPGIFIVTLTVRDAAGNTHSDTMTVTVNDITPPMANAGPDQTVDEGTMVTFDGSASTDNVGIVNYTWTFNDGAPVTLWGVGPTYLFNNVGVFPVTLTVRDAAGHTHTDTMTITVLDITPPTMIATVPANGASTVGVNQDIVITFSEPMNTGTVTYTVTPNPGNLVGVWSAGNTVLTMSHDPFQEQTLYTIHVTAGEDVAGNNLAAGAPNPWTFTTGDFTPPIIISTVPADGEIDVLHSADIVITFSEPMDTATVSYTVTPNPGNLVGVWSAGNTVLTISHDPFQGSSPYVIQVNAGQDMAGNNLAAGAVPNPWSFTTMVTLAVDYIRIETLENGGTVVGDHTMTIDQTFTVWAVGYSASGVRIGTVEVNWTTTGGLDLRTAILATSFTFDPVNAISYGAIRATFGALIAHTGLITVNPGATVSFVITPLGQTITADGTLQFTAQGRDAMGNPSGPVTVTWAISHDDISAGPANGTINAEGLFTPGVAAVWTVSAVNATLNVTRTTTVTVVAGALAGVSVSPGYAQANAGQSVTFTVAGHDAKGNEVAATGTVHWYLDGQLRPSGTIASNEAGNHTVFASVSGFLGLAYMDITSAQGNRIVFDQTGMTIDADGSFLFSISILDAYGNPVSAPLPAITWSAGNGTIANGLFTPWSAGTWTIRADSTGYVGGTAEITVTSGSVSRIVISPSGGTGTRDTSITVGQSMLFAVNALDQKDNLVGVPSIHLTWAATIGTVSNGFFTAPTSPGTGMLSVIYSSGGVSISGSENITVGIGPLHHIIISPVSVVSLNEYQTFTAAGYDIYGNQIPGLSVLWSTTGNVGTIDASGVFRGTGKGLGAVTAMSSGIQSELPVYVSTPAGIFASWLWLAIVLFIVCIILVVLLMLGRRQDIVAITEPEEEPALEEIDDALEEGLEDELDADGLSPDEMPEEFMEPIAELEQELADDGFEAEFEEAFPEPEVSEDGPMEEGPEMTSDAVKAEITENLRVDRCEKMLSAVVVLPDDKERMKMLIEGGITPSELTEEIKKAVDRRKKKEKDRDVTAEEKAAILEDELVAELAELEENLEGNEKEVDLEDEILREIEDLEDL